MAGSNCGVAVAYGDARRERPEHEVPVRYEARAKLREHSRRGYVRQAIPTVKRQAMRTPATQSAEEVITRLDFPFRSTMVIDR